MIRRRIFFLDKKGSKYILFYLSLIRIFIYIACIIFCFLKQEVLFPSNTLFHCVLFLLFVLLFLGIYQYSCYLSLKRTLLLKMENTITIIQEKKKFRHPSVIDSLYKASTPNLMRSMATLGVFLGGTVEAQMGWNESERQVISKIDEILNAKAINFRYKEFSSCKLIKETKRTFIYSGLSDGKEKRFKIYKVYKDIEFFTIQA